MFNLEYAGSTDQAATAIAAMVSGTGTTPDTSLLAAAKTFANAALAANYLQGTKYTGNVYIKLRGGWADGTLNLSVRISNVAMTGQNEISVGDPTTRF